MIEMQYPWKFICCRVYPRLWMPSFPKHLKLFLLILTIRLFFFFYIFRSDLMKNMMSGTKIFGCGNDPEHCTCWTSTDHLLLILDYRKLTDDSWVKKNALKQDRQVFSWISCLISSLEWIFYLMQKIFQKEKRRRKKKDNTLLWTFIHQYFAAIFFLISLERLSSALNFPFLFLRCLTTLKVSGSLSSFTLYACTFSMDASHVPPFPAISSPSS